MTLGSKYSITLSSFRGIEPIEQTLERLVQQGYDGVEMFCEPKGLDLGRLQEIFHLFDIPVCAITGVWGPATDDDGWRRKFISVDASLVEASQTYLKQCIEMCRSLGAHSVNICLFADDKLVSFDRNHSMLSEDQKKRDIDRVVPILSELSRFAYDRGVKLLLEPLNRFNTPHCTTAADAVAIAKQINQDNFGVLLDTFHMNIEEDSFENAIAETKGLLQHVHFADNNRKMPGSGHINFKLIVSALSKIDYKKYISFEPNLIEKQHKSDTEKGLKFIKSLDTK